jgi:hypothetical protein
LFYSGSPRILKGNSGSLFSGRRQLMEENDWIFVNMIPMLCAKSRIAKQQKIETWLNLAQLIRKLSLQQKTEKHKPKMAIKYMI